MLVRSCQQIVNGLVDLVMEYEKSNMARLVGCMTALHSFAQIRPQLIIEHAITLEPYLNIKCSSNEQIKFISLLAEILEEVIKWYINEDTYRMILMILGRSTNGTSWRCFLRRIGIAFNDIDRHITTNCSTQLCCMSRRCNQ